MWNVRGARFFGLVASLAVALVFFGASQLDAKKPPKPPEVQWQVAIPGENTAGTEGCSLYGAGNPNGYVTFQNVDSVEIDVFTNQDPETKIFYTVFTLTVAEPESIGFQNLDFQGCRTYCDDDGFGGCLCEGDCLCQYFPPAESGSDCCPYDCCSRNDPDCNATGYIAMKQFME